MCKAPEADAIPSEVYKHAGPSQLCEKIMQLFQVFWKKGDVMQDFKDASIIRVPLQGEKKSVGM